MRVIMHWIGRIGANKEKENTNDVSSVPVLECNIEDDYPETFFEVTEL